MGKIRAFANTTINYYKSMDECQRLLAKYGVAGTRFTNYEQQKDKAGQIIFEFNWSPGGSARGNGYKVQIEYEELTGPKGGKAGITKEQAARAIFWHIKNLIEAVEFGIVDMGEAFLPYMLTSSGQTVYEEYQDRLLALPETDKK